MLLQPVLPVLSRQGANAEQLRDLWKLFTKVKDNVENGRRIENLSWRLWYRSTSLPSRTPTNGDNTSLSAFMSEIFAAPTHAPRPAPAARVDNPPTPSQTKQVMVEPLQTPHISIRAATAASTTTAAPAPKAPNLTRSKAVFFIDTPSTDSDEEVCEQTAPQNLPLQRAPPPPYRPPQSATVWSTSETIAPTPSAAPGSAQAAPAPAPAPAPMLAPPVRTRAPAPTMRMTRRDSPASSLFVKTTPPAMAPPKQSTLSALLKNNEAPGSNTPGKTSGAFAQYMQPYIHASSTPTPKTSASTATTTAALGAPAARPLECSESLRQGLLLDRQPMFNFHLLDSGPRTTKVADPFLTTTAPLW